MFDLDAILIEWRNKYGEVRIAKKNGNPYPAIPIRDRKELFRYLVEIIKNKGKDQFFFKQDKTKNTIAAACFPPDIYDKEARKRGYQVVWRELAEVVADTWPDPDFPDRRDITAPQPTSSEYNPSIHDSPFKELDRSKVKSAPTTQDDVDEEMNRLLGFSDE